MNVSNDNGSKVTSPAINSLALLLSEDESDVEDLLLSEEEKGVEDLYATCNEYDGKRNVLEGKAVLPEINSTNMIGDANSNSTKDTIPLQSCDVDGTQPQPNNRDKSTLYDMSSTVNTWRSNILSNVSGDVANTLSDEDIDDALNIYDVGTYKEKRKESPSPYKTDTVVKIPRLQSVQSGLEPTISHPHPEEIIEIFNTARSIQDLEVVFASIESIPPIQKTLMLNTIERKMNKQDVVLRRFREKSMKFMKIIREHGLVHCGTSIGQVSWISLVGGKESEVVTECEDNDDLSTEGVVQQTRASRLRYYNLRDSVDKVGKEKAAEYMYESRDIYDEYDFKEEDMAGDSDFAVTKETSKKGKGRGKGLKGGKIGGGRGRGRKKADIEKNPSVASFYSPVKTEDMHEERMGMKMGNVSPTTAMCNRILKSKSGSGPSGNTQQSQSSWLERRSSPRTKPLRGSCPMCGLDFDMVHLETHASECEGN